MYMRTTAGLASLRSSMWYKEKLFFQGITERKEGSSQPVHGY